MFRISIGTLICFYLVGCIKQSKKSNIQSTPSNKANNEESTIASTSGLPALCGENRCQGEEEMISLGIEPDKEVDEDSIFDGTTAGKEEKNSTEVTEDETELQSDVQSEKKENAVQSEPEKPAIPESERYKDPTDSINTSF